MTVAAKLTIKGRVQGVWYRASTHQQASDLGLVGWVRNMPDGSVEVFAQGSPDQVEALIRWCKGGPPLARVDRVAVDWTDPDSSYMRFQVRY